MKIKLTLLAVLLHFALCTLQSAITVSPPAPQVQAGQSGTNAQVGGPWFSDSAIHTNHSTVGQWTNLANISIPANMLTNNGDTIRALWGGFFMPGTNHVQMGLGSQTNFLDTGAQTNGAPTSWDAWLAVTRTGNTGQHIEAGIRWNFGGGMPFARTNVNLEITETNGIATLLSMQGRTLAGRAFGITNNSFKVFFEPATK